MEKQSVCNFFRRLYNKKEHYPLSGQLELTYRCNLNCIHCYCKGSEEHAPRSTSHATRSMSNTERRELTTQEWKEILDEIQKEGCIWLTFTGGDPLLRNDFLEIYAYAKIKGFIITVFTNGYGFTSKIIDFLAKSPPCSIEITLNGIGKDTYEAITQGEGSFEKVMANIKKLKENKMSLVLKTNSLKQNKNEVAKIKKWTQEFLGKPAGNKHYFKYDPMIYPRLNGDKTPTNYRLSFEELLELKRQDPDIWKEYEKGLHGKFPAIKRDMDFLHNCDAWISQFFINPYGRLKFCVLSDKFSIDLKTIPFREGFYNVFPQLLNERFKTDSKCKNCSLRPICYNCPARAYLETGNEEAPVPYYCELAKATAGQMINRS